MRDRREQSQPAPEQRAQHNDELPRVPVRQRPYKRSRNHVETKESAGQISDLCIAQMKLILHQRLHREQHVAVRIIEQVECREDNQRGARLEISLSHRSSEYSMPSNHGLSLTRKDFKRIVRLNL
jgi:hypothetical protein